MHTRDPDTARPGASSVDIFGGGDREAAGQSSLGLRLGQRAARWRGWHTRAEGRLYAPKTFKCKKKKKKKGALTYLPSQHTAHRATAGGAHRTCSTPCTAMACATLHASPRAGVADIMKGSSSGGGRGCPGAALARPPTRPPLARPRPASSHPTHALPFLATLFPPSAEVAAKDELIALVTDRPWRAGPGAAPPRGRGWRRPLMCASRRRGEGTGRRRRPTRASMEVRDDRERARRRGAGTVYDRTAVAQEPIRGDEGNVPTTTSLMNFPSTLSSPLFSPSQFFLSPIHPLQSGSSSGRPRRRPSPSPTRSGRCSGGARPRAGFTRSLTCGAAPSKT